MSMLKNETTFMYIHFIHTFKHRPLKQIGYFFRDKGNHYCKYCNYILFLSRKCFCLLTWNGLSASAVCTLIMWFLSVSGQVLPLNSRPHRWHDTVMSSVRGCCSRRRRFFWETWKKRENIYYKICGAEELNLWCFEISNVYSTVH